MHVSQWGGFRRGMVRVSLLKKGLTGDVLSPTPAPPPQDTKLRLSCTKMQELSTLVFFFGSSLLSVMTYVMQHLRL